MIVEPQAEISPQRGREDLFAERAAQVAAPPPVADSSRVDSALGNIQGIGAISFPVQGAGISDIRSVLGQARGTSAEPRLHKGIDIFADSGTPVLSATGGTVVAKGEIRLGGMRVAVEDGKGNRHYYAHLSGYANGLEVGDVVTSGQPIGQVGKTGNAETTLPHLHYSINETGSKPLVDPLQLFQNNVWAIVDDASMDMDSEHVGEGGIEDPSNDLTGERAFDIVRQELPYMLAFMEIPELRSIFVEAAASGRSSDEGWILSELWKTDWWKSKNEAQRLLETQKHTDPTGYNDQIVSLAKEIRGGYIQLGYQPPAGDPFGGLDVSSPLYQQAETYLLTGMSTLDIMDSLKRAATAGVPFDPLDPTPPGQLGNTMASIASTANQFMVNVSEEQAYEWAQKVAVGDMTTETLRDMLREMSISKFSFDANVSKRIQDGFTPQQLFSEHRNVIARALDMDPDQVDFDDPQFSMILNGGAEGGSMSVADTRKHIRGSDAGGRSREVQRDGNEVLLSLMETFGVQG